MQIFPIGATIPEVTHYETAVNGTTLHYVAAGSTGAPILLVHGFPESWWAFHKVMPLLAHNHRVFAVDLRGFGDSQAALPSDDSKTFSEDLYALIQHLDVGPVHLVVQDISGASGVRLAAAHPEVLLSLTGIETGLAGFGLETLADVAKGGAWYIGLLATPGAADRFFKGREKELIGDFIMPFATAVPDAVNRDDIVELARGYGRDNGWGGALALYGSMLREGDAMKAIAKETPITAPTMAIDRHGSDFTRRTLEAVHSGAVERRTIDGVGHYVAMEAPEELSEALLDFAKKSSEAGRM